MVAIRVNNLAALLQATSRLLEVELLMKRALVLWSATQTPLDILKGFFVSALRQ